MFCRLLKSSCPGLMRPRLHNTPDALWRVAFGVRKYNYFKSATGKTRFVGKNAGIPP
jgi:hypothetical protein